MSFIDQILAARSRSLRDERGAVQLVQRGYENAADRLKARIKELKKQEKLGVFRSAGDMRRQAEAMLAEVEGLADIAAKQAGPAIERMKEQVIQTTIAETVQLAEGVAEQVTLETTFAQVPTGAVEELAARPIAGTTAKQGAARISQRMVQDVKERLIGGLASGESLSDISKDVADIADLTESAAARLTRTELAAASNDALRAAYEANDDVIDGYTWDATLDERVCARCGALHGTFYPTGSNPPGPPLHPNCRCVLVPHLVDDPAPDAEEYKRARPLNKTGVRAKASRVQKIPADTKFESWLRKQPSEATQNVTGSQIKDDLWRSGKVPFTDLVKPDTSLRTDAEVVQLALARKPGDKKLKSLADQLGVRKIKASTAQRKITSEMRDVPFTLGERKGLSREMQRQREKIDAEKRSLLKRRDAVQRAL